MVDFPGMGGDNPLPGADPLVPSELTGQFAQQAAREQMASAQRMAQFREQIETGAASFIHNALHAATTAVVNQAAAATTGQRPATTPPLQPALQPTGGTGAPVTAPHSSAAPVPTPGPGTATPQSSTPVSTSAPGRASSQTTTPPPTVIPHASPQATPVVQPPPTPTSGTILGNFREGRQEAPGGGMSMGQIQKRVAGSIASWSSQRAGDWERIPGEAGAPDVFRSPSLGRDVLATSAEGRNIQRVAALAGRASTVAEGGSLLGEGALGSVATKVAGPVGIAVGVLTAGTSEATKQFDASAVYRQAYGEQAGGQGMAPLARIGEWAAGLGGLGTSGVSRSREAFKSASSMGLQGDARDSAVSFAHDMYMKFGMDTSQSMQMVQQAVESGNTSLSNLASAIAEVSRSAVAAGRSSNEAIQQFAAAQAAVSQNLVTGQPSMAIAQNAGGISDSLDRSLATSIGGAPGITQNMLTRQNIMGVAAQQGQDPLAAVWRAGDPATATQQASRTMAGSQDRVVEIVANQFGMNPTQFRQHINTVTNGRTVSDVEQHAIIRQMAGSDQQAQQAVDLAKAAMAEYGQPNVPDAQIINMLFADAQQKFGTGRAAAGPNLNPATRKIDFSDANATQAFAGTLERYMGIQGSSQINNALSMPNFKATNDNPDSMVAQYIKQAGTTGQRNRGLEWLLSPKNADALQGVAGTSDLSKVKFQGLSQRGRIRELTMEDILASKRFQWELGKGQISVESANSSDRPTSVAEMAGLLSKDPGAKGGGSSTTTANGVTVGLTNKAAQLLQIIGPSEAQKTGTPAAGGIDPSAVPYYGAK